MYDFTLDDNDDVDMSSYGQTKNENVPSAKGLFEDDQSPVPFTTQSKA